MFEYMRTKFGVCAIALSLLTAGTVAGQLRKISEEEVMRVHRSALLIDTHNDITSRTVEGYDIGKNANDRHTNIAGLRRGGVGAQFFAVFVAATYVNGNHSANRALQMIDTVRHDIIARYPNEFLFATTAEEIEQAHQKGKIAALMGVEGGHAIEDSLRLLRDYYALGVRYMTLTHSNTNNWADSSGDMDEAGVKHHNGLTDFGKDVVREMNRLGMMVDISHVADKTFWDALEISTAPVFASHSSCRAISNVARNMTDDMLNALAKKGGLIQINFACEFLSQAAADASKTLLPQMTAARAEGNRALMDEYRKKVPPATLADVVEHIGHAVKVAGIEAVGIGSDFDGIFCAPKDLEDVSKFPNLTRALLEKGYSAADIHKIYGSNLLRVMRAVEAESRALRSKNG